jgi:hypothetical protein
MSFTFRLVLPLGTTGIALTPYDTFRAYEGTEGRKNKNK